MDFEKKITAFFVCVSMTLSLSFEVGAKSTDVNTESVGLVLSGGGARGFAHIGALKALEELRVPFDCIAANSMGAMVGGGYAAGYTADEIKDITLGVDWVKMFANRTERPLLGWETKRNDERGLSSVELGVSSKGVRLPKGLIGDQELNLFLSRSTNPVRHVRDLSTLSIPFRAVATDLENGEKVVLEKDVTLAEAMRASMSIPGAFPPVEFKGRLLVDGMLVENLPLSQARAMGAKRLIVINVGTPLSTRDELSDMAGVMGQMINILTEKNVKESLKTLTKKDIYIVPKLDGFATADFRKTAQIVRLGYDAVMEQKDALKRFSVDAATYARWAEAKHTATKNISDYQVSAVRVEPGKRVNSERIKGELEIKPGEKITEDELAQKARFLWASGDFEGVTFHSEPGKDGKETIVFEPKEKSMGYSTLRVGGWFGTDFRNDDLFNLTFSHTLNWINDSGAYWRNELQFGHNRYFESVFHQPFMSNGNWYTEVRARYERTPFQVYSENDTALASYAFKEFSANLSLGWNCGRSGRVQLNAGYMDARYDTVVGMNGAYEKQSLPYAGVSFDFDTLDNISFPRKGLRLKGEYRRTRDELTRAYDKNYYSLEGVFPIALGRDWSLIFSGKYGHSDYGNVFELGGAFNLSGSPYARYTGNRLYFGRVMALYSASELMTQLGMPVYLGATYEMGRAWSDYFSDNRLIESSSKSAMSLFVGADTWFGPMYLIAGRTFGRRNSLVGYWGRVF